MRTKKVIYNNLSAALLQIITLLFGLIIPRLMVETYGSQLNGLFSSSKQIVSYLRYLELGITTALIYTLYAPLAKRDYSELNPLVTRAKKESEKISLWYTIGTILLALIYPLMIKESIGYGLIFTIVLFVGIYGALDFLTLSKYRVLLMADQRYYVITLTSTVTVIFQNLSIIALIHFNLSIVLIALVPMIFLPFRSLFFRLYVKKKYSDINYKSKPSEIKLDSRKDAFISGIANTLNVSLPLVVVSLVVSLEKASVFSIYSMVFLGISGVVGIFTSGMSAAFGNMFAKNQQEVIKKGNNYFEFLIYMLLAVLYSTTLALIIPFINIYIGDVADINYIYSSIAVLFTIWSVIYGTVIPNQTIINASGKWKLSTKANIIQIIILVISMVFLGYFWEINGILIGMVLSSIVRTISLMYISNNKILNISNRKSFFRILRIFIIIVIINLPLYFNFINMKIDTFVSWVIHAIIVTLISGLLTFLINIIFDWKTTKELFYKYIKKEKIKEEV